MTRRPSLDRQDWLAAGFRKLADVGPSGLKAEVLARDLGTTKGSFYWHFADLTAYKAALLAEWRDKAATAIMAGIDENAAPADRLKALIAAAKAPPPETYGGRRIEPAIRAWALNSSDVAAVLAAVDTDRIAFVYQLLSDVGAPDPATAMVFYAAYLGLDDIAARHSPDAVDALDHLSAMIFASAQDKT